jgi:hypothetical protein
MSANVCTPENLTDSMTEYFLLWIKSLEGMDKNIAAEVDAEYGRIHGRRQLVWTDGGRFGQGTESIIKRDEVLLFSDGFVPFVLRPIGEGKFHFIGEAYVHGIMHGEVGSEQSGTIQTQFINIM